MKKSVLLNLDISQPREMQPHYDHFALLAFGRKQKNRVAQTWHSSKRDTFIKRKKEGSKRIHMIHLGCSVSTILYLQNFPWCFRIKYYTLSVNLWAQVPKVSRIIMKKVLTHHQLKYFKWDLAFCWVLFLRSQIYVSKHGFWVIMFKFELRIKLV